ERLMQGNEEVENKKVRMLYARWRIEAKGFDGEDGGTLKRRQLVDDGERA
ncbi:hypothetical protein TorRG33x02_029320, partial [Trema orientale]